MTKTQKLLDYTTAGAGFGSLLLLLASFLIFEMLRPKMIRFQPITTTEEGLVNVFGFGLLFLLAFCLLSLYQIIRYLKNAASVSRFYVFLLASGVLAFLFVFSDVALISDIGKQYRHTLSQPEWPLLYAVMAFQFATAALLTYVHLFGLKQENQVGYVARDANLFLIVHSVGLVCGFVGLSLASLGFLFPRAWRLSIHVTAPLIILLTPYVLVVAYWLLVKLQERPRQWLDEKQRQDIGYSAVLTLVVTITLMTILFVANYANLDGIVSLQWFPLFVFTTLFTFSAGTLYFGARA